MSAKLQEIEEMKRIIEQREREASQKREHAREQREDEGDVECEVYFHEDGNMVEDEGDGEDDSEDDGDDQTVVEFLVGARATHSLLKECTIMARPREDGKVQISWTRKRKGRKRGAAAGIDTFPNVLYPTCSPT